MMRVGAGRMGLAWLWVSCIAALCVGSSGLAKQKAATTQRPGGDNERVPQDIRLPHTPPVHAVVRVTEPPNIDGKLDDAAWIAARPVGRFHLDTGDGPMRLATDTRFVSDDTYLYMAVECELAGAGDKPVQKGKRDNVNWGGETIELFLDPDRSSPGYAQIIFDMGGAFTDMLDGMDAWDGDITACTSADKTGWRLEVRLRMSDLGGGGRVDPHLWGANVCRSSDEGSGSWADLRDTFQQPDAFGLLTFTSGGLAVEDVGAGIYGLPHEAAPKTPVRLALRNPTSQPVRCLAEFTAIGSKEDARPVRNSLAIPPGETVDLAGCVAAAGAGKVRVRVNPADPAAASLFEIELPVNREDPAPDTLLSETLACAIRPAVPVATARDQAAVYLLAQSLQGTDQHLTGYVAATRTTDGYTVAQLPVSLRVPAGGAVHQRVPLPSKDLAIGQYDVIWVPEDGTKPPVVWTQVCYNPLEIGWLRDLLKTPRAANVLGKLGCDLPEDPADLAIVQARIDRLADRVEQQAADPKTDLSNNIRTLFGQLMQLVGQLRRGQSYTTRQRGWFECAIRSPVDDSAQPCNLFVPYDYDKHPDRRYPLEVNLHAGGGTHGGAGYRAGLDRDVTDRLILHPLSRGGHAGYTAVSANDVINQVRDVMQRYRIDPDAVHITGESMGGFGSFSIPSTYPDVFATSRPICGGGFDHPVEQMCNVATFPHHGMQDATVPALLSQISAMRMLAEGCPVQLYVHDGAGHGVGLAARRVTTWSSVKDIRRDPCPRTVVLCGGMPQLKHSYWLSILRCRDIHKAPYLRASFAGRNHLVLSASNVAWAKVSLPCKWIEPDRPVQITTSDGLAWTEIVPGSAKALYIRFDSRKITATAEPGERFDDPTAYIGGGAATMFWLGRPVRIIYGTTGSTEQTETLAKLAKDIRRWGYRSGDYWSGGYPILRDSEVTARTLETCDLIVLGTPGNNALLARMADRLPVKFATGRIAAGSDPSLSWPQDQVAFSLFYRDPLAPTQRIWWFAGIDSRETFDRMTLLTTETFLGSYPPELIVQSKDKRQVVGTAFLDSQWNLARPAPVRPAREVWPTAAGLLGDLNQRFADSFAVDAALVSMPGTPELLDWERLTVGEALLAIAYTDLLKATVLGEAIAKGHETFVQQYSGRVKDPVFCWAGIQPETIDPQVEYRVLASPAGGIIHQAQSLGFAVRDCELIPADQVWSIVQRYLQDKLRE